MSASAYAAAAPADPKAAGDVIGNNGFLGLSGHVGIWDGSYAVEVLNDKTGVNKTCVHYGKTYGRTLATFKQGGYWGARYDSSITSSTLLRVIDSLKSQGDSYKATYSLVTPGLRFRTSTKYAWVYNTNKTVEWKQITGDAKLRCDFGVAMAFREKAAKVLFNGGDLLPSTVYNKMPKAR